MNKSVSTLVKQQLRFASSATAAAPLKTALYDAHVALGGKMVTFCDYLLPVQYKDTITQSHLHCRSSASIFDVSHMGQVRIHGAKRVQFMESIVPSEIAELKSNQARLSCLTNSTGGVIDDCLITNKNDHIFMVVNAGCKHKDMAHMQQQIKEFNAKHNADISMEYIGEERSLLALQGPKAASVLQGLVKEDLSKLPFMFTMNANVGGIDCWVTRCGYTGEDGFEISVPAGQAVNLLNSLLANKDAIPAGLGARDSLRLEAGLCLYGHELNESINPIEAGLAWLIGKRRRAEGGFLGDKVILDALKNGTAQKRVGLLVTQGAPARENVEILNENNEKIGVVTSGTLSPSLKKNIAIAYVKSEFSKVGTKVQVNVRGKINPAEVTKMPFVQTNYYKPPQ